MADFWLIATLWIIMSTSGVWSDDVPVLIWNSDRTMTSFPPSYAGHRLSSDAFAREYLDRILDTDSRNNVAIFIEDQLSMEEMRDDVDDVNVGHFAGLKKAMDASGGVVLPAVASAVDELNSVVVESWTGPVYRLNRPPYSLATNNTDDDKPCLFVVKLSRDSPAQTSDAVSYVIGQLEQLGRPFVGLYTSQRSSPVVSRRARRHLAGNSRRRLLQFSQSVSDVGYVADGGTFLFVNMTNCLYLYAENITITTLHGSWVLPFNPVIDSTSYCANYSAELTLIFPQQDNVFQFNMTMVFGQTFGLNAGYWYMSNFSSSYIYINGSIEDTMTVALFPYFVTETPFGLSYSCSYVPVVPPLNYTAGVRNLNVTFQQFQVQAFNISDDQFGYYNDCVGFFNITIWCVLFVLLVLFLILADGVCMLMSLETCDRTDDPRGKTITIIAAE